MARIKGFQTGLSMRPSSNKIGRLSSTKSVRCATKKQAMCCIITACSRLARKVQKGTESNCPVKAKQMQLKLNKMDTPFKQVRKTLIITLERRHKKDNNVNGWASSWTGSAKP